MNDPMSDPPMADVLVVPTADVTGVSIAIS
jgi:hypothetical protein